MARKNVFNLIESDVSPQVDNEPAFANSRPLAGFEKPLKRASPVGAISQSLGGVHEKAQRVDALEKQLAQGQAIVELDTAGTRQFVCCRSARREFARPGASGFSDSRTWAAGCLSLYVRTRRGKGAFRLPMVTAAWPPSRRSAAPSAPSFAISLTNSSLSARGRKTTRGQT